MADSERKSLVWTIKKGLLTLSADELFQIAKSLGPVPGVDRSRLAPMDEEACFDYISSFMHSKHLQESEDEGLAHLLELKEVVDVTIQSHVSDIQMCVKGNAVSHVPLSNLQVDITDEETQANVNVNPVDGETVEVDANAIHPLANTAINTHNSEIQKLLASYEELSKKITQYIPTSTLQSTLHSPAKSHLTSQNRDTLNTRRLGEYPTTVAHDKLVSLRELSYLHRREFKIQGGQIGDHGSDISYNNVCRQIEEGVKEQFSDAEIVKAVLRAIKPGISKICL
ncbi:uncharacterized protein LOC124394318 [Silurus meridionalis]|uniref:uncharacterized protein LOC124394318 n=1 Tax=Silurus meridionalis TaxID=175797 RepID=UPI001EEB3793|nr:uncharacterized protein LOC124394318 [Silurus meridionalis]